MNKFKTAVFGGSFITRRRFFLLAVAIVLAAGGFLHPQQYIASRVIKGFSMEPTLHDGDRCIIGLLFSKDNWKPARGDIVIFLDPHVPGHYLVKRIVGLPEEVLELCGANRDYTITDGSELAGFYDLHGTLCSDEYIGYARLGPGEYFVMGDNRTKSFDSRTFGPVKEESILGKLEFLYWPPSRAFKSLR